MAIEVVFAIAGVICLIYAIIGKNIKFGVKDFNVEVQEALKTWQRTVFFIFGIIFVAVALWPNFKPQPQTSQPEEKQTEQSKSEEENSVNVPQPTTQTVPTELPKATQTPLQENVPVESTPTNTVQPSSSSDANVTGFRLCNRDAAGDTFAQTDPSTGITRVKILPAAQVFFISTNPATITFSPNSGLPPISSSNNTQYVVLGKNVPGLEWIEINPGFSYTACIYSLDQLGRAKYEADNDMSMKKAGDNVSEYYSINGQNIEVIESFP